MLSECLAERCLQQVKSFRCDTAVWPFTQANSIREWWRPLTQSLLRTLGIPRTWEKSSLNPPVVVSARYVHLCRSCSHRTPMFGWTTAPFRRGTLCLVRNAGCCTVLQASTFPNGCHQLAHRLCSQGDPAKPKREHHMVISELFICRMIDGLKLLNSMVT